MKKPIWEPSSERIERANINRFVRYVREQTGNEDLRRYAPLYEFSVRHPERFWPLVWEFCGIRASGTFHEVVVDADRLPGARWFPGIRLNFAQNLLRFRDERAALIGCDSRGQRQEISYAQLQQQVARAAAGLRAAGLRPGDKVLALLPNGVEAVVALLAAVAAGAVWSALPLQAPPERIQAAAAALQPRLLIATAAASAHLSDIELRIIVDEARPGSVHWPELIVAEAPPLQFELAGFDHPLCVLHGEDGDSSLHSAGGTLIQHLKELLLHADLKREDHILHCAQPGQTQWYWLVSALAVGATLVLADDLDLDSAASWDLVDQHAVSVLAVTAGQLQRFADGTQQPQQTHKLLALKTVLAFDGPLPAAVVEQVYARVKPRLMLSSLWGDAGGLSFLALGCPLLPVYSDESGCRGLGMKVEVLDADGAVQHEQPGRLACLAPFPALPLGLLGDSDGSRFQAKYFSCFPNTWCRGETACLTAHDGVQAAAAAAA